MTTLRINAAMRLFTFVFNLYLEELHRSAYLYHHVSIIPKFRPLVVTGLLLSYGIVLGIDFNMVYTLLCFKATWALLTLRDRQRLSDLE